MPPPPPPPPPPPGMGGPPPPPPPPGGLPTRPPVTGAGRGVLLGDIAKGKALKKTVTNDRSAPQVGKTSGGGGGGPPIGGAPPVPGLGLAPPVPSNRARSNSDQGSRDGAMDAAPQLGGLFAGGMPKLKKRGGGVDTGANQNASYLSDPESSSGAPSAPKPPSMGAPRPPVAAAPAIPGRAVPPAPGGPSFHPSIANLRRTANSDVPRPMSSASTKGPPPPIGKKPPPPPGRKPSSGPPPLPGAPAPPPPPSSAPVPPAPPPSSAPSIPHMPPPSGPPRPPARSQPPPPPPSLSSGPSTNGLSQNMALQAAKLASGGHSPPGGAPPAPPPPPPAAPAPGSVNRARAPSNLRTSMLDPSSYTLSHNGAKSPSPTRSNTVTSTRPSVAAGGGARYMVEDNRWRFTDEAQLPKPRQFQGGVRKYRAGRGSSVPLDLSAL